MMLLKESLENKRIYLCLLLRLHYDRPEEKNIAERGFDPPTFELWAQRDTTTPPCYSYSLV